MNILEWIESVGGTAKAADILKETPRAVASWKYGEKVPKPQTAQRIVMMTKGKVDYNGIYAPLFALQAGRAAKALIKKGSSSD